MPPHVEFAGQSEWQCPRSRSTGDIESLGANSSLCGSLDSPLFRDEVDVPTKSLSSLDRGQSNPDLHLQSMGRSERIIPAPPANNQVVPFVSKIELIIGPESRYYNKEPQGPPVRAGAPTPEPQQSLAPVAPTPPLNEVVQESDPENPETATTPYNCKSSPRRPFMLRLTHSVSKKGWKVVRYIGEKGMRFFSLMVNAVDPTSGTYEA